jgi:beta-1,4-mannosyltransferase
MEQKIRVAFFPYGQLQENPYQNLIIKGLNACNVEVIKIPGRKFFPLLQIWKVKPDVLHIFWPHDLYIGKNKITALIKQISLLITLPILKTTKAVYSADNLISHEIGKISVKAEKLWISRILEKCHGIVFMSNAARETYINFYGQLPPNQVIIPHVNFESVYINNMDMATCRTKLDIKTNKVFCLIGRIHPYKGIVEVINAFKSLQNDQVTLLICGKCSSEAYMRELINACGDLYQNNIKIINLYIPNDLMQVYINAADYLILNYADKPINPGTAILALTFNKPVIAKADNVIQEVLGYDYNFYFTEQETLSIKNAMQGAIDQIDSKNILLNHNNNENDPNQIGLKLRQFYVSLIN